ncbi:mitochondrial folate carrier protein [Lasallia pustulata]|uniref:Mitochondrial folate carrier protein n=1 Tax=Lasallia pustulata TaxID=136370 RepID=A0A1W5CY08_9LECA|nr:mitochondrial folate carrier protein [Lasallia pustulata]
MYQLSEESKERITKAIDISRVVIHYVAAFYRGLTPNLIGNSVSWALYFWWYSNIKDALNAYHGPERGLSYYDYFIASGAAGALTAICTNPIWVIKTRMLSTSSKHAGAYTSVLDGTRHIYRSEGFSGFYRGLVPSLFGVSHGAFQFTAYEQLKNHRASGPVEVQKDLTNVDYLWLSGLSKIFAGTITYPYQVVRARLQTYDADKTYRSARDVVLQVRRQEGWGGFYKGLGPNLLRVVPSTCVTFLVYENARYYLPRAFDNMQQS